MDAPQRSTLQATRAIRRAGNLAALAVVAFGILYVVSSQLPDIRAASPWAEDPPDAAVSVAAMLVPFAAAITFLRVQRHRGREMPLPATRDIAHGIAVALGGIWAAVLAAVLATVTGTRADAWNGSLGLLVGLLLATVGAALPATIALLRAWPRHVRREGDDVMADAAAVLRILAGRAPQPVRGSLRGLAARIDAVADARLGPRRAPWLTVVVVALVAAVAIVIGKFVTEGVPPPALLGRAILALGGIMALIVVAGYATLGRFLNLIGPPSRSS